MPSPGRVADLHHTSYEQVDIASRLLLYIHIHNTFEHHLFNLMKVLTLIYTDTVASDHKSKVTTKVASQKFTSL